MRNVREKLLESNMNKILMLSKKKTIFTFTSEISKEYFYITITSNIKKQLLIVKRHQRDGYGLSFYHCNSLIQVE